MGSKNFFLDCGAHNRKFHKTPRITRGWHNQNICMGGYNNKQTQAPWKMVLNGCISTLWAGEDASPFLCCDDAQMQVIRDTCYWDLLSKNYVNLLLRDLKKFLPQDQSRWRGRSTLQSGQQMHRLDNVDVWRVITAYYTQCWGNICTTENLSALSPVSKSNGLAGKVEFFLLR